MVSTSNATIVLDPHIAGSCVITLDEAGACALRDALTEWLNEPGRWCRNRSDATRLMIT
jgi:hypothetical protein